MGRSRFAMVSLAAITVLGLPAGCDGEEPDGKGAASPTPTEQGRIAKTPAPPSSSAAATPAPQGKTVQWQGMKLTLPEGWQLRTPAKGFACFQAPGKPVCGQGVHTNASLQLSLVGGDYSTWPSERLDEPNGWAPGDPPFCMAAGSKEGDFADQSKARITVSNLTPLADGRKAAHREWAVPCRNGSRFATRVWYLPTSKVAFYVMRAEPDLIAAHEQIVKSADLTGFRR